MATNKKRRKSEDSNQESRVSMNVGGTMFTVNVDTVMQYPDTMLGSMLSERWSNENQAEKEIFLDRDPVRFRYILDFYRNGKIVIPHNITKAEMLAEIEFFALPLGQENIQYDIESLADLKQVYMDYDAMFVQKLKKTAREGAIVPCANEVAALLIGKLRLSPSSETYVSLERREIPDSSFAKAMYPGVLRDALFQKTIRGIVEQAGYKINLCHPSSHLGLLKYNE
mmetsp:Transcript_25852/g.63317  ORF Transcript_25852/g.63317 Transcript_25852/m.63317 type:complete len:226 (+) Transcript_25852:171-848(+)